MKIDDTYAKSPLCECLGSTPQSRVLMFFIANPVLDYDKTEIAHATGMARQTVYAAIDSLERFGLIEVKRKIANTSLYHRKSSKTTDAVINFNKTLVSVIIEEEKKKMAEKKK